MVEKQHTSKLSCIAQGVKLRRSWRVNGFLGELYRIGASYPIEYEDDGEIKTCRLSKKQQRSDELRSLILQGCRPMRNCPSMACAGNFRLKVRIWHAASAAHT